MHPLQPEKNMVLSPLRNESWIIPLGKPTGMAAKGMGNLDWLVKMKTVAALRPATAMGAKACLSNLPLSFPSGRKANGSL